MKVVIVLSLIISVLGCRNRISSSLNASPIDQYIPIPKCEYNIPEADRPEIMNRENQIVWGKWRFHKELNDLLGSKNEADWSDESITYEFERDTSAYNAFEGPSKEIKANSICAYDSGKLNYIENGKNIASMNILMINIGGNSAFFIEKTKGNADSIDMIYLTSIFGDPIGDNDILFLGGDKLRKDAYTAFKRVN